MKFRPPHYLGIDHKTLGSDILAVLQALSMPEAILGEADTNALRQVDPDDWYPIDWLLELMETLDARIGPGGLLKVGKLLFRNSHEAHVRTVACCARDIIYGIDGMYRHANRGEGIGGWTVISFEPGRAILEKNTPHHCVMEEGILMAALSAMGCPAGVRQTSCIRRGDPICRFAIDSSITDKRWSVPT